MSGLVLRLWVLSLAILFQASNWNVAACCWALVHGSAESNGTGDDVGGSDTRDRSATERDEPADGTKELSGVDDWAGHDVLLAEVPNCCSPAPCDCGYAWVDGLAPGGPPADAPFKPPRA